MENFSDRVSLTNYCCEFCLIRNRDLNFYDEPLLEVELILFCYFIFLLGFFIMIYSRLVRNSSALPNARWQNAQTICWDTTSQSLSLSLPLPLPDSKCDNAASDCDTTRNRLDSAAGEQSPQQSRKRTRTRTRTRIQSQSLPSMHVE